MKRLLLFVSLLAITPNHASASTVINYDFNNQSFGILSKGNFWTMQPSGGVNNSPAARLEYSKPDTAGKNLTLNVSSLQSNEFYIEFDVKVQGTPSGGTKFVKLFGDSQASKNNMTLGWNYWGNTQNAVSYYGDTICASNYSGTTDGCTGTLPTHVVKSSAIDMRGGSWGRYKAWVKRASSGASNGEVKVWWNGTLRAHITNMHSAPTGFADPTPGFYAIELGGYNHSNFNGSIWYLWIDNLTVSTTSLTTNPTTPTVPPPTGLIIK